MSNLQLNESSEIFPEYWNKNKSISFESQVASFGRPDLRIEFMVLPSWNDVLSVSRSKNFKTPSPAETMISKWRQKGFEQAIYQGERQGNNVQRGHTYEVNDKNKTVEKRYERFAPVIFTSPVKCFLRYWRPTWHDYDSFSPFDKPVVDGFKDAGVFPDDSFKYIPNVETVFCGVDKSLVLSETAKQERKDKRAVKVAGRMPTQARFWFDFYKV